MITENRGSVQRLITSDCEAYLLQRKGALYREYRKNWDRDEKTQFPHPMQLNIALTSFCNLHCKMCYRSFFESKTREFMSMELVDQIAEEAKALGVESIWLGASSECLLHPNIIEVLEKFARVGTLDYWLATNGTLLNEKISEKIVELPVTWLTISLDAATPQTYKSIRGGNLDVVEQNISTFLKIREAKNSRLPFLRVSFVDMEENHGELEPFKRKWENVADKIDIQTLVDFSKDIADAPIDEKFDCRDPRRLVDIKHDGEIMPCCNAAYKNCGRRFYLRDMSIQQFWESDFHEKLVESVGKKQYGPCCMECVRRHRSV